MFIKSFVTRAVALLIRIWRTRRRLCYMYIHILYSLVIEFMCSAWAADLNAQLGARGGGGPGNFRFRIKCIRKIITIIVEFCRARGRLCV